MADMSSPFEDPSVREASNQQTGTHLHVPSQYNHKHVPLASADSSPSLGTSAWPPKRESMQAAVTAIQNPVLSNVAIQGISNSTGVPLDDDSTISGGDISIPVGIIELKEIEQWAKRLRVAYMIISAVMAIAAFLSLGSNDLGVMFMALYVWFFALLIFCSELALKGVAKLIAENFGFMYHPVGRIIFLLFVGVMCFELGLLGKIVMVLLCVASFVHIYVIIIHPAFEEYVRKKHYYNVQLSAASGTST